MFKIGDKVKFKKSSIDIGMIDATEDDVFTILYVEKCCVMLKEQGYWWNVNHFEHLKEEIMQEKKIENQPINWEGSQIDWQVGQEVWCIIFGKGEVIEIDGDLPYPLRVSFEHGENTEESYTMEGKGYIEAKNRTLFFSEPKIEAEKFPPKKPFVPILKKGDVVFIKVGELYGEGTVRTIYKEIEDRVFTSSDGMYFLKKDIKSLQILSEEIKFS